MPPPLDGGDPTVLAALQVDAKDKTVKAALDPKDSVVTQDMVDSKDRIYLDPKDAKDSPVFALSTQAGHVDTQDLSLFSPGGIFANLRTTTPVTNISGGSNPGGPGVTTPPIGTAVPEPSTWALLGVAGAMAGAFGFRRRKAA